MTIISNHRIHSYKSSASVRNRDLSPKKTEIITKNNYKRNRSSSPKQNALMKILLHTTAPKTSEPIAPPPSPSAPPAVMQTRTIYVWGTPYQVDLPDGFDIYEGLRLWYPNLYTEVCAEMESDRNTTTAFNYTVIMPNNYLCEEDTVEDRMTDDEYEEMWAYYDFLEWLCD